MALSAKQHLDTLAGLNAADASKHIFDDIPKGVKNGTVDLHGVLHGIEEEKVAFRASEDAIKAAEQELDKLHTIRDNRFKSGKKTNIKDVQALGKDITKAEGAIAAAKQSHVDLIAEQRFGHIGEAHVDHLKDLHAKDFSKKLPKMNHHEVGSLIEDINKKGKINLTGMDIKDLEAHHKGLLETAKQNGSKAAAKELKALTNPSLGTRAMNAIERNGPGIWKGTKATFGAAGAAASATKVAGARMGKGALVGAGIVALGSYLAFGSRGKKFDPMDQPIAPIPPLLTPQDLMMQQQASMMPQGEMGPAEGYAPNQWQSMVRPGQQQQQQVGAAQPRMSAISPEAVQNLGGMVPQV